MINPIHNHFIENYNDYNNNGHNDDNNDDDDNNNNSNNNDMRCFLLVTPYHAHLAVMHVPGVPLSDWLS